MGNPTREQTKDNTLELGKWPKGMVNSVPGKSIPNDALLDAKNIDLDVFGSARMRAGYSLSLGGQDCKSVAADKYGLYYTEGSILKKATLNAGLWTTSVLRSNLNPNLNLCWEKLNGFMWYSNGVDQGKIAYGDHFEAFVESPAGQPMLGQDASGDLPPGRYGVAVVFVNQFGEESTTGARAVIDLAEYRDPIGNSKVTFTDDLAPAKGKIILSNIPQPVSADVKFIRVYVSEQNGTMLRQYADLPVGTTDSFIVSSRSKGIELTVELMNNFPACEQIQACRGRMFGSIQNTLYYSIPMRPSMIDNVAGFVMFPEEITMIAAVDDGLYVVADKTYWIEGGDFERAVLVEKMPQGEAARGTLTKDPVRSRVFWLSKYGQVVGGIGGQVSIPTIGNYVPPVVEKGASLFRRVDGIEHVVNTFPNGETQLMGARAFADAVIIRKNAS